MIRIYGAPPTRGLRPVWLCEEMGLAYELAALPGGRWDSPEFREINPGGFVPVLEDGDVRMVESVAMMEYLAGRYGPTPLAPGPTDPAFADYQQYLHLGEAGLGGALSIMVGTRFFAPDEHKQHFGLTMAERSFASRMKLIEHRLRDHAYMAGEDFTAADISIGYSLGLAVGMLGLGDRMGAPVHDYLARLHARPAYQRATAARPG